MSEIEQKIKSLIEDSLRKRISGLEIDPELSGENIVERSLTDIMALGYNDNVVEKAAQDIYEVQKPMEGTFIPQVILEDIRARVFFSQYRFSEEISAFQKYMELRDAESEEIILYKVREELQFVAKGDFMLT